MAVSWQKLIAEALLRTRKF